MELKAWLSALKAIRCRRVLLMYHYGGRVVNYLRVYSAMLNAR